MLSIEIEREVDGRWIGEVPELPGVLAYGAAASEAKAKAMALAFHVIADRIEHGEQAPIHLLRIRKKSIRTIRPSAP
jgi:predicted RNase H-like HicB family nuclease